MAEWFNAAVLKTVYLIGTFVRIKLIPLEKAIFSMCVILFCYQLDNIIVYIVFDIIYLITLLIINLLYTLYKNIRVHVR